MEKYDSDEEFDIVWNDDVVDTNVTSKEDDQEFVKSILGTAHEVEEKHSTPTPTRESEEVPDSAQTIQANYDKTHVPYVTKGGKHIRVVHDDWGTFWHIEFVSGGQLPLSLSGKYTTAEAAQLDIELYLASQE